MTSRYASLTREQLATLVPELLLIGQLIDRSGHGWLIRPFGHEGDAADRDRAMGRVQPGLHQAHAEGAEVRRRRRHHDLQGPAARHRCTAAVHGLSLHGARPLARRIPPRLLWRTDGCRADGRGLGPWHVPRHRGSDVRRDRGRHQPEGPGATDPPAAAGTRRPASALPVDCRHRRVVSPGERHPGPGRHPPDPCRRQRNSTRSTRTTRASPTTLGRCCPTSTSVRSRIRRWFGSPTKCACRCTC